MEWREREGVPWLEAELPQGRAVFSTRQGGVSTGPFASLNLGWITGDEPACVYENRRHLARAAEFQPANALTGFQVHGAEILRHSGPRDGVPYLRPPQDPPEVDGHATSVHGLAPVVLVADCLPVALSGPDGVAMLHCGWRGLATGIIDRGGREVGATTAAIGPGIGPCCFEVGEEVLAEFIGLGDGIADGRMLDLPEVAERQLRAAGVEEVERANFCTSCNPELFYSHRRDSGETGRQAGVVINMSGLNNGRDRLRPSDSASRWPS
jgi:polyphenol oxidase